MACLFKDKCSFYNGVCDLRQAVDILLDESLFEKIVPFGGQKGINRESEIVKIGVFQEICGLGSVLGVKNSGFLMVWKDIFYKCINFVQKEDNREYNLEGFVEDFRKMSKKNK